MYAWNMFESVWLIPGYAHGYRDQIILGCTGITAIAILIGVIFLTKTSCSKKIALILLVSVPIYVVNIFRNVFVIMAYFGQWFPWFEDVVTHPTIPGFASYFWSHNVMCEGGAFLLIILIAFLMFKFSPGLLSSIRDILDVYVTDLRALVRKR
jgi:archaeosortase A (PGF-CTERM-specific)